MKLEDLNALIGRLKDIVAASTDAPTVAIVGYTPTTLEIVGALTNMQLLDSLTGIYVSRGFSGEGAAPRKEMAQLRADRPAIVVIASDEDKEALLSEALPYLNAKVRVLIGGFSHFNFRDPLFESETRNALIPSFANGYPNSLIHIFQCLKNSARLGVEGIVVEFGMFKGGTTMLMSRFIEGLGKRWKVYGFDSFNGFPPPRSPLDMYNHPDCVFLDEPLVRRMFEGRNVEIVSGDVVQTVAKIKGKPIVLAFVDTDNFTSANAALDIVQDQVSVGGAIIFDHFTGRNRFLYTLGERIAAKRLIEDDRYFNLHDTGVFLRQR